jgi:hypothetical protein
MSGLIIGLVILVILYVLYYYGYLDTVIQSLSNLLTDFKVVVGISNTTGNTVVTVPPSTSSTTTIVIPPSKIDSTVVVPATSTTSSYQLNVPSSPTSTTVHIPPATVATATDPVILTTVVPATGVIQSISMPTKPVVPDTVTVLSSTGVSSVVVIPPTPVQMVMTSTGLVPANSAAAIATEPPGPVNAPSAVANGKPRYVTQCLPNTGHPVIYDRKTNYYGCPATDGWNCAGDTGNETSGCDTSVITAADTTPRWCTNQTLGNGWCQAFNNGLTSAGFTIAEADLTNYGPVNMSEVF